MSAYDSSLDSSIAPVLIIIYLVFVIFYLYCFWRIFEKADEPGWAAIIPFYNYVVILRIAGKPWWWLLLMFVPLVNIFVLLVTWIDFAARFGKSAAWGFGLWFLSPIFIPILAFDDSEYLPGRKKKKRDTYYDDDDHSGDVISHM